MTLPVFYSNTPVPEILIKLGNIIAKLSGSFVNSDRSVICREINADLRAVEMTAAIACGKMERPQEEEVYYPDFGFVWNGNTQLEAE
jgi:hypothetical protein